MRVVQKLALDLEGVRVRHLLALKASVSWQYAEHLELPHLSTPHAHIIMDLTALFAALTPVLGPNKVHTLQLLKEALKTLNLYKGMSFLLYKVG